MKTCNKCSTEKPESAFYKKEKGRLSGSCKKCEMKKVKEYRARNLEYYRQIDRNRNMEPHRVSARKEWLKNHPERARARNAVSRAVKSGKLMKQPCIVCGGVAEGHHPDYSSVLDVVWLCRFHHKQVHAMIWV